MASITSPRLNNTIRTDVPAINAILKALAKADPSILSDIENGTKRFYEGTSGWEFQELKNGAWTTHTKFNIDAQSVDGFNTSVDAVASTIVVRGTDGKLKGNLTGKADTAGTADKLASTLLVNAGGTGATSAADARVNLGVPPTNHKSTTTNYGVSSATEYGHSMAGSDTPKADSGTGAVGSDVTHFARQDHVHPQLSATSSVQGDVKLSDATNSTSAASASIAATPKAVKAAYDLANTAKTTANAAGQAAANAQSSADAAGQAAANAQSSADAANQGLEGVVRSVNGVAADAAGDVNVSVPVTSVNGMTGAVTISSVSTATTATNATAIPNVATWGANGMVSNCTYNKSTYKITLPSGGTWRYMRFTTVSSPNSNSIVAAVGTVAGGGALNSVGGGIAVRIS